MSRKGGGEGRHPVKKAPSSTTVNTSSKTDNCPVCGSPGTVPAQLECRSYGELTWEPEAEWGDGELNVGAAPGEGDPFPQHPAHPPVNAPPPIIHLTYKGRIKYFFLFWSVLRTRDPVPFLTPGSGMGKNLASGSGMNNPLHISESLETIFLG